MVDDEPELFDTLAEARTELQDHLLSAREAAQRGDLEESYSPNDHAIADSITGQIIPVVWDRDMETLRIQVVFKDVLARVLTCLTDFNRIDTGGHLGDQAQVACEYGIESQAGTIVIVLPSIMASEYDMHAIAPPGCTEKEAKQYVDVAIRKADCQDPVSSEESKRACDNIHEKLKAAGFQMVCASNQNLVVSSSWDAEDNDDTHTMNQLTPGAR